MNLVFARALFFALLCINTEAIFSSLSILKGPALNCTQEGLKCKVKINNCLDKDWLKEIQYTPSGPVELEVGVSTRRDETGDLVPVIVARWKANDDGSIQELKGTEMNVLMMSTNSNLCVQYKFFDKMAMKNPAGEKWSFSMDRVVVQPDQSYHVSVSNLPKPNLQHTGYNINKEITIPGCKDPEMQRTKMCLQSGSLWEPNVTLRRGAGPRGAAVLVVGFSGDERSENYRVSLQCSNRQWKEIKKNNQASLSVTFDLEKWPRTCCSFDAEIQPFFTACGNDCGRKKESFNICRDSVPVPPSTPAASDPLTWTGVAIGVLLLICVAAGCMVYVRRRKIQKGRLAPFIQPKDDMQKENLLNKNKEPPRVLVIYSQDHQLYKNVVLKLCAFLQAKCGTQVVLDLLDSTWLGTVGRLPWLEWQRQQVQKSSDKILVLCSRGVQAKWRAMCGQGQVTLREDVLSPVDDMLTPALNLFLPDMQRAAALGKYMVAYFDEVSSEGDVPSIFDIAVKYKLMKHFEELYFRILDIEKYQPGQVSHIEGIGGDEYFNCPSGKALRDAIEKFQAYQLEHPDWFEKECVDNEEEVLANVEYDILLEQPVPPILQCVPEYRTGPPICVHEVELNQNSTGVHILIPEVNQESQGTSVLELLPRINSGCQQVYPFNPVIGPPPSVLISGLYPRAQEIQPFSMSHPALNEPAQLRENWLHLQEDSVIDRRPIENEEEEPQALTGHNQPSPEALQKLVALQLSLSSIPETPYVSVEGEYSHLSPLSEVNYSQPVEMAEDEVMKEEDEVMESAGKRPNSGSDQGYISRMSLQQDSPVGGACENPLVALARLQEELYQNNDGYSGS